jgi:putative transposase
MGQRKTTLSEGEFYHLYNRGNSKQDIFLRDVDYNRFMQLMYLSNGTKSFVFRELDSSTIFSADRGAPLVAIGAYCLMPNHFHILATPLVPNGVQTFMQKLSTGYSMYFNKKHTRTGGLFEGRFKSKHTGTDEYLKYLFSYISLNPIKLHDSTWKEMGIKNLPLSFDFLRNYTYSSYVDYLGARKESAILNRTAFPIHFDSVMDFNLNLTEWLTYSVDTPGST